MRAVAEPENFRRKYYEALDRLEHEEGRWKAHEGTLRRLVTRLCVAAEKQHPDLDSQLTHVSDCMRRSAGVDELERLFDPLSRAIAAIDAANRAASLPKAGSAGMAKVPDPTEEFFGNDRVRNVLKQLLEELRRDGSLANDVLQLEERLEVSLTQEQLPGVLTDTAELVTRRIGSLQREKHDIEQLLRQVTSRLDEFAAYLTGSNEDRKLSLENTADLNMRVLGEMRDLGTEIATVDVDEVQQVVQTRLAAITQHLQEHRSKEQQRADTHWERSERMRQRVERLEQEARDLHDRLRDEQRLALVDSLTQIPNRLAYDQRMEEELKRFRRFGGAICIAAIDIDRFKSVNDSYGHKAGDKVLRVVADTFAERVRETDFVARYGGEEFVALLAGASIEDGRKVMDEMRAAVESVGFHFRSTPITVTVSCGITLLREGDSADDAFERADKALYEAKQTGRNRCVVG